MNILNIWVTKALNITKSNQQGLFYIFQDRVIEVSHTKVNATEYFLILQ